MKPKVSTGYLTPQAKKTKVSARYRLSSDAEKSNGENKAFDEDLFQAIMQCPEKKKMILQLLSSNKETIDKYRKNEKKLNQSPLNKLKSKRKLCESPTALLRRRALEQLNSSPSTTNRSDSSKPNSRCSDASSKTCSPIPFENVLDRVIAYVEIKSRQGEDMSAGAKEVLKSMGAQVRESFTNDVTHVIFKDGSYTTFQKAKLLKVYLVSILWVEFCRKTRCKQDEKQYPAMRSGFDDETMVCSQMHKEYEDIIREEYRRSIIQGTPLPTTKSLIDRRRTLMTPSVSKVNSSSQSFKTAEDTLSSQELSDREVAAINGFQNIQSINGEDLIMNDSECFSGVSGPVVNVSVVGKQNGGSPSVLKSIENMECSDMELTPIPSQSIISRNRTTSAHCNMEITSIPEKTVDTGKPKIPSKNLSELLFDRRKTICSSFLSYDSSTRSLISSDKLTDNTSLMSSDESTNISDNASFAVPKGTARGSKIVNSESSSSLLELDKSFVISKNFVRSKQILSSQIDKTASAMSELKLSLSTNDLKSSGETNSKPSLRTSSSMSTLQVSSELRNTHSTSMSQLKLTSDSSKNTDMSSLRLSSSAAKKVSSKQSSSNPVVRESLGLHKTSEISSEKRSSQGKEVTTDSSIQISNLKVSRGSELKKSNGKKSTNCFGLSQKGPYSIIKPVKDLVKTLPTQEFATVRKKCLLTSSFVSVSSDDSEIILPQRNIRRHILRDTTKKIDDTCINNHNQITFKEKYIEQPSSKNLTEPTTLIKGCEFPIKTLVVNIVELPNSNFENKEVQTKTRRKTLGCRTTEKREAPSTKGRRKTVGLQELQKGNVDKCLNLDDSNATIKPSNVLNFESVPTFIDFADNIDNKGTKKQELSSSRGRRKTFGTQELRNNNILNKSLEGPDVIKGLTTRDKYVRNFESDTAFSNPADNLDNTGTEKQKPLPTRGRRKTLGPQEFQKNNLTHESRTCHGLDATKELNKKPENADNVELASASSVSTYVSDNSDSSKLKKKLRKLYNPDKSLHTDVDDENEREEKRSKVKKRKSDERMFINPINMFRTINKTPPKETLSDSHTKCVTPPKRPRKINKNKDKPVHKDISADEQKDLLNEVLTKKTKEPPKTPKIQTDRTSLSKSKIATPAATPSRRRSTRIVKPTYKIRNSRKGSSSSDEIDIPLRALNRRSTLEFMPLSQVTSSKKVKKIHKSRLPTIVCTKLHKEDVQVFGQIVKKLGRFNVEDEVSDKTTHVVAGEPKRTINMLKAVSRGCWILKFEWVLQSLEEGKWLPEEQFEMTDFSPVVQKCRLERQAFGEKYTMDIFQSCPPIFVASCTTPRSSDLKELITTCKGKVVTTPRRAKIVVGQYFQQEETVCVNETWVLDCITFYKKLSFKQKYLLDNKKKSLIV